MAELAYVSLEEAAELEGITYETIKKRAQRSPEKMGVKKKGRDTGGKELTLVAVSSLSKMGQNRWKEREKMKELADTAADLSQEEKKDEPWYVKADYEWFERQYKNEYFKAMEFGNVIRRFLKEEEAHRKELTVFTEQFAQENIGKSGRTFRRMVKDYQQAEAWATKLGKEDGCSYDHLMVLALCRKPKDCGLFPSIPPDMKQAIKNIWFNKDFAVNRRTRQDLYEVLEEISMNKGWKKLPSYQTVVRYISYTWYPPNGFRCRCSVASLSVRQVKERGLEVETGPPREVDTRTGEIKEIRPDKGFAVNPARHAWEPDMEALSGAVRGVFEKEMHKTPSTLKNSARQGIVAEKKNRCVITRYNAIVGGMGGSRSVEDRVVYVLDGMDASEAPDEIKLLPLGKVHSQKGDFLVDDESYELINRQFKERGLDLVIDYEHQTLKDVQAPAGGWIKELIKQEDAIAAKVEWTPRAKEYLRNKEYKYLSPVVICRKSDGKAVALHSAALTNTPAIDRMFALVNSIDIDLEGDVDMEEGGTRMELKKIIELLGLPEGATEEDVVKALSAARKAAEGETVANKTILGLLELKEDARTEDVAAKIMALKGTEEKSKDEMVMELKRRLDEKDADGLVMNALKQGKISAAQKEWAKEYALKDPKGFEAFVAKAPTVVPVKKIATGGEEKTGRHTDLDARILKNLGISVDDLEVKE